MVHLLCSQCKCSLRVHFSRSPCRCSRAVKHALIKLGNHFTPIPSGALLSCQQSYYKDGRTFGNNVFSHQMISLWRMHAVNSIIVKLHGEYQAGNTQHLQIQVIKKVEINILTVTVTFTLLRKVFA